MPTRSAGAARAVRALALAVVLPLALAGGLVAQQGGQEGAAEGVEYALVKPLAVRSLLLDGVVVGDLMVVVGERGHVLRSRDDGATWQQATSVPTRASLTGVFLHDESLGWAVGHDAVILRTRDGGDTWERLHWAPEEERPFLDVWFSDAENGFAVGAYGYFLKTADGGDSWEPFEIGTEELLAEGSGGDAAAGGDDGDDYGDDYGDEYGDEDFYGYGADYHLNQVSRSASGRLYIAAEAGTVYRSDDGGASWVSLPSPYEGSFFGTLPLEGAPEGSPDTPAGATSASESLLLFGLRGHLFRSDDAGESWSEIPIGTQASLTDARRLKDGRIVVAGLAGTLLVSADGGRTFELRQQADRQGLTTVLEAADGALVLVGEFGVRREPVAEALGATGTP